MEQISLFWPVILQHSRLALLLATVAVSLAVYSAKRRVQRLNVIAAVKPLQMTMKG